MGEKERKEEEGEREVPFREQSCAVFVAAGQCVCPCGMLTADRLISG